MGGREFSGDEARPLTISSPIIARRRSTMPHISLPAATRDIEVRLHDPEKDAQRIFRLRVLTRSKKREIAEIEKRMDDARADIPDEGEATEAQEEAMLRTVCDLLNVLLVGAEDGPQPGDLLYDAWVAEDITDDQIIGLMNSLAESAQDPT